MTRYRITTLLLALVLMFFLSAEAQAAYKVFLKNGNVIGGVSGYRQIDDTIECYFVGGTVTFSLDEVDRIEKGGKAIDLGYKGGGAAAPPKTDSPSGRPSSTPPPTSTPPSSPALSPDEARTLELTERLEYINTRLSDMEKYLVKYNEKQKEFDSVRLRIENLFQIGMRKAKAKGKKNPPAVYLSYLSAEERKLMQLNLMKKRQLTNEMEPLKETAQTMLDEKKRLLEEKARIEDELKRLKNPNGYY